MEQEGLIMASNSGKKSNQKSRKSDDKKDEKKSQSRSSKSRQSQRASSRSDNGERRSGRESGRQEDKRQLAATEIFDPVSGARIARLRIARNWRFGGSPYAAMHAYEHILARYGGTPAASAAAEELISMADELERQGKFYSAMNILNKIEQYYDTWQETYYDPWRTAYVRPK
jgi:hypothetical protein